MKLKKHSVIKKICALLVLVAFVGYRALDFVTTTTTTSTTTSASGIIHDEAKANIRGFADENDNAVDYAEAQHGYAHGEEAEVRTFSSSSSSTKNRRRAKQKEILKTINGHAKMLPDKSPSRAYDILTDDDDDYDGNVEAEVGEGEIHSRDDSEEGLEL